MTVGCYTGEDGVVIVEADVGALVVHNESQ
jgi:hypothetical protein